MRAVADVSAGVVHASVEVAAPPERVFRALTDPVQLAAWWGAPDQYRTHDWRLDLRAGAEWSCKAKSATGDQSTVHGRILAVEPPTLLVLTWNPSWEPPGETTIRYELSPIATGTRVVVRHSGFARAESCQGHAQGWDRVLGWLASHFAGR